MGQLEAELLVRKIDEEGPFVIRGRKGLPEGGDGAFAQIQRALRFSVAEEVHCPLQKASLLIERDDFETALADGEDIHLAIGRLFQHAVDARGAAEIYHSAVNSQHDAKYALIANCGADHLFVALFKDVQGQLSAGQQHHIQRKQGDQHSCDRNMACYSRQVNCAGKVVLITGASEGIGLACARLLLGRGAKVAGVARNAAKMHSVEGLFAVPGDLTQPGFAATAVQKTMERFGRVDVLINNAGIGLYAPSWQASMDDTRQMFELNLMAPLALIQAAVPHMRTQREGVIVNIGSIAGKVTLPWLTLYSASKYALGSFTDGLRIELAGTGIRTMLVCPSYVNTDFQSHVLGGQPPPRIFRARGMAITAEQCAEDIIKGIERNKRTVVSPKLGWALIAAARLFPRLVDAQLRRVNESHSS